MARVMGLKFQLKDNWSEGLAMSEILTILAGFLFLWAIMMVVKIAFYLAVGYALWLFANWIGLVDWIKTLA